MNKIRRVDKSKMRKPASRRTESDDSTGSLVDFIVEDEAAPDWSEMWRSAPPTDPELEAKLEENKKAHAERKLAQLNDLKEKYWRANTIRKQGKILAHIDVLEKDLRIKERDRFIVQNKSFIPAAFREEFLY